MSSTKQLAVYPPEEVARRLGGISVAQLVAILKAKGYPYTELKPGSKPWGRGRQVWGMTDDQINALINGQTRQHPVPGEATAADDARSRPAPAPGLAALGHDGKSRIRFPKAR